MSVLSWSLSGSGWHPHWRRSMTCVIGWQSWRSPNFCYEAFMSTTDNSDREAASPELAQHLRKQLERLNDRANAGEAGALAELEEFLKGHPEVLAVAGDLARHAEKVWIDIVVGTDSFTRVAVTSQVEHLKAELAGPDPSPLERLLADHVVMAHLAERQAELSAAQTDGSIQQASFRLKKAESAQRRFLAATKSLATLRALQPRVTRPNDRLRIFDPERKTG